METNNSVATAGEKNDGVQEIILPSGRKAVISAFKGKHIREATRLADGESDKLVFALIAITTKIDGKPVLLEDMDEMDGRDAMKLTAAFSVNF